MTPEQFTELQKLFMEARAMNSLSNAFGIIVALGAAAEMEDFVESKYTDGKSAFWALLLTLWTLAFII